MALKKIVNQTGTWIYIQNHEHPKLVADFGPTGFPRRVPFAARSTILRKFPGFRACLRRTGCRASLSCRGGRLWMGKLTRR